MANEAAEVRQRLVHEREQKEGLLAEPALDVASDSIIEAVLRSVAAKAELMAMQEVRTGEGLKTQTLETKAMIARGDRSGKSMVFTSRSGKIPPLVCT